MLGALAALLALACGLAACGGSSTPSAQSLVHETFSSGHPIESGRIDVSFALSSSPSSSATGSGHAPFALRLRGPFQSLGSDRLPQFALQLGFNSGGQTLKAGVTSTEGRLYIELGGSQFLAPEATVRSLQQAYAEAARSASSGQARSSFSTLGVDPGEWLVDPRVVGSVEVLGVQTVHIVAGLNTARFLAAAAKVSASGGVLGLGSGAGGAGALSPALLSALAGSLHSARVEMYTGAEDHLLRRLSVSAAIVAATPQARAALGGSRSATLAFVLQFAGVNRPQTIPAPPNPRPLSELGPALQRLGV